MARTRALRVAGIVVLTGMFVWTIAPYAINHVSTDAVVNAPLTSIKSPIDGHVVSASPPVGTSVLAGAPLLTVGAQRKDLRSLEQLKSLRDGIAARIEAINAQEQSLGALADAMSERLERYRTRSIERLQADLREVEAELVAARAHLDEARRTRERSRRLLKNGHISDATFDQDHAAAEVARGEVMRLEARLERLAIEIDAARQGAFVRDGWNDVPYSHQRRDEVQLRLVDLAAERWRLNVEREIIATHVEAEQRHLAWVDTFTPTVSAPGIVWKASSPVNSVVTRGEELVQLVDCERRFVDVLVPAKKFDVVSPGAVALVRLEGDDELLPGRVTAVRGLAGGAEPLQLAAAAPEAESGELRVMVELAQAERPSEPNSFCHMGRTAEVRFPRRSLAMLTSAPGYLLQASNLITAEVPEVIAWLSAQTGQLTNTLMPASSADDRDDPPSR